MLLRRSLRRALGTAVLLALLLLAWSVLSGDGAATVRSETSATTAPPQDQLQATPTYVSELAPAVLLPPREPNELPASGVGGEAGSPWPKATGLALTLLGGLLVFAALTLRPRDA